MKKYSSELKKKIVMEYLNGEGGYRYLANKYNIPDKKPIRVWVNAYKKLGEEGLQPPRERKTFEIKLNVVKLYLTTEVSYMELAMNVGINDPSIVARWVKAYRIAGPDALRPKRKGQKVQVTKSKKQITQTEKAEAEYLRQLEEENLKLRIENAYLKELRRLRLEDEAKNGKRG